MTPISPKKKRGQTENAAQKKYPHPESNRKRIFRRNLLYPFNYGGIRGDVGT